MIVLVQWSNLKNFICRHIPSPEIVNRFLSCTLLLSLVPLQKHNFVRLLAYTYEEGLHIDSFKLPISCSCHLSSNPFRPGYHYPAPSIPFSLVTPRPFWVLSLLSLVILLSSHRALQWTNNNKGHYVWNLGYFSRVPWKQFNLTETVGQSYQRRKKDIYR